jgi:preprotein translocase SecF subunit
MKPFYTIMFVISVALLLLSFGALAKYGLNYGVDFTGGSFLEVEFKNGRPPMDELVAAFASSEDEVIRAVTVTPVGDAGLVVRSADRTHATHGGVTSLLMERWPDAGMVERQFDFIGPAVGDELKSKSMNAIVILLIAVLLYIAYMFRSLSRSLSLWAMAVGTVLGLAHDIVIPMGVFAVLGHVSGVEITAVYVAAVLTILGYTVSDKVVIYDRVRENLMRGTKEPLPDLVHRSVMQTIVRSVNNTLVVMLSSLAVFLFGGESIRYFALSLMMGIGLGAYSSIFVAAPVLVWMGRGGRR